MSIRQSTADNYNNDDEYILNKCCLVGCWSMHNWSIIDDLKLLVQQ